MGSLMVNRGKPRARYSRIKGKVSSGENRFEDVRKRLFVREEELSSVTEERDMVKRSLRDKEAESTMLSHQVQELKSTVTEQGNVLDTHVTRIAELSEKERQCDEQTDLLQQKDNQLKELNDFLNEVRHRGDGMDASTQATKIHDLEEQVSDLHQQISDLESALRRRDVTINSKTSELDALRSNMADELRELREKMAKEHEEHIAALKQQQKEDFDRMLEVSQVDLSNFEQVRDDLLAASQRADQRLLDMLVQRRQSSADPSQPNNMKLLLTELQQEADDVLELVLNYPEYTTNIDASDLQQLQQAWANEKRSLLAAMKALKDLISKMSQTVTTGTPSDNIRSRRSDIIQAVKSIFDREQEVVLAEVESLRTVPESSTVDRDVIAEARRQLERQDTASTELVSDLENKDRELLLREIQLLSNVIEQQGNQFAAMNRQQTIELEQQGAQIDSLQNQYEESERLNKEQQDELKHFERRYNDMQKQLAEAQEESDHHERRADASKSKMVDLIRSLEREQLENGRLGDALESEVESSNSLSKKLKDAENRIRQLEQILEDERSQIRDASLHEHSAVVEMESALNEAIQRRDDLENQLESVQSASNELKSQLAAEQTELRKARDEIRGLKEQQVKISLELEEAKTDKLHSEDMLRSVERQSASSVDGEKAKLAAVEARLHQQHALVNELQQKLKEALMSAQLLPATEAERDSLRQNLERAKVRIDSLEGDLRTREAERDSLKQSLDRAKVRIDNLEGEVRTRETERAASADSELTSLRSKLDNEMEENIRLKDAYTAVRAQYAEMCAQHPTIADQIQRRESDLQVREKDLETRESELETREADLEKLMGELEAENEVLREKQEQQAAVEKNLKIKRDEMDRKEMLLVEKERVVEGQKRKTASPGERSLSPDEELSRKIKRLEGEKVELRDTMRDLEEQVMQFRKKEEEHEETWQKDRKDLQNAMTALRDELTTTRSELTKTRDELLETREELAKARGKLHKSDATDVGEDGRKLINAGWTIAKVQRLYLKYFRAESFRKALAYQKQYILLLLADHQQSSESALALISKMGVQTDHHGRPIKSRGITRFRVAARAVMAVGRMQYLVRKYQRNLYKSSPEYPYREKPNKSRKSKSSPSKSPKERPVNHVPSASRSHHPEGQHTSNTSADSSKQVNGSEKPVRRIRVDVETHRDRPPHPRTRSYESRRSQEPHHSRGRSVERPVGLLKRFSSGERVTLADRDPRDHQTLDGIVSNGDVLRNGDVNHNYISDTHTQPIIRGREEVTSRVSPEFLSGKNSRLSPEFLPGKHSWTSGVLRQPTSLSPAVRSGSPPRAYPRPLDKSDHDSPPVRDSNKENRFSAEKPSSRSTSPSRGTVGSRRRNRSSSPHIRDAEDPNTSLNNYIRKLESLQARLKDQTKSNRAKPTSLF